MLTDALGRPLRDLRISVTDQCNFRCTYCMPKELYGEGYPFFHPKDLLDFDQLERLAKIFVGLGVEKIKITGGEPLLRLGLDKLLSRLVRIPKLADLGLITNGYHLLENLAKLKAAGLKRLNVSLDSLEEKTLRTIAGKNISPRVILKGVEAAVAEGFHPVKVNMVVQKGVNDHEVLSMVQRFKGTGAVLRFIEYMDVGARHRYSPFLLVPSREIKRSIEDKFPLEPLDADFFGEVAERYAYRDGSGEIGFISSMTQPFCGSCTRLRLSADGRLYRCLFSGLSLNIKSMLGTSSDEEIAEAVTRFWRGRKDRYSDLRGSPAAMSEAQAPQEMYRIGG